MILSVGTYPVAPTATMATIKMNTENVLCDNTEYGDLIDEVIEEYGENMRERFGYDEVTEDYIEECRYYEVNMLDNTEDEALDRDEDTATLLGLKLAYNF